MKKLFLGILIVGISCVPTLSYGYFEYKFRCEVSGTRIGISLDTGELCFDFLKNLHSQIVLLNKDIENAGVLIEQGTDVEYRNNINSVLEDDLNLLLEQQRVILTSMSDFEKTLFGRVKDLLQGPIGAEKKQLFMRINTMRDTMQETKKQGAQDTYTLIVNKMEVLQYRLFVLDRMLYATDFEEIVPFVRQYLTWDRI